MANRLGVRKKILFSIIMLCLPFLFAEAVVRVYFATQVGPRVMFYGTPFSRYQATFDPKGAVSRQLEEESTVAFHENVTGNYSKYYPNQKLIDQDEFGNTVDVAINSRGFRGEDFELTKRPGVIRIVTLGASSTFGFRNHDAETYPSFMEEMLNDALPAINAQQNRVKGEPITGFEVINLGIPHLRTEQIYSLFVNEALELEPDFVTFSEGINDAAWFEPPDSATERTKQTIKAIPFANEVFRALRYRLLSVALIGTMISEETRVNDVQSMRDGKSETFISNLQGTYEASRENYIQLIVANQQATGREGRGEAREDIRGVTHAMEQAMVRETLSATGSVTFVEAAFLVHGELMEAQRQWAMVNDIPYADVIGAIDASRQYLVTWVHLNSSGNRVVASVLSDEILRSIVEGIGEDLVQ